MRLNPTLYYKSKVRHRRWGTTCDDCSKLLEVGSHCMRAMGERNTYGCMTYYESCFDCWKKLLPKSVEKEKKELKEYIVEKKKQIKELEKLVKG